MSKEWHFSDEWEEFSLEKSINQGKQEPFEEEPLLNQDEIDSLLSHYNTPKKQMTSGLEHLLGAKNLSYDNIAFLDNILKNFSYECLNNWRLALLFNDDVEYYLLNKNSVSLRRYIDETLVKGVTRVIKSNQCDSPLLINFSSECAHLLIESLLGGCQTTSSLQHNGKPLTKIEDTISLRFIHSLLRALEKAFSKFIKYDFYLERQNNLSGLMNLSDLSDNALLIKFILKIGPSASCINILFPVSFLEAFKQKLNSENDAYRPHYTAVWRDYLTKELEQTNLTVEAKLSTLILSLEEVLNWKVGTQIGLPLKPSSFIPLECGGFELMLGEMGRCNNSIAFQIKRNKLSLIKEEK
jgi:flagellar motor switch protein FliM